MASRNPRPAHLPGQSKEKMKEGKEKVTMTLKEGKDKDARYTNGHLFSTITVSGTTMCFACNKSITAKEALSCPSEHPKTAVTPGTSGWSGAVWGHGFVGGCAWRGIFRGVLAHPGAVGGTAGCAGAGDAMVTDGAGGTGLARKRFVPRVGGGGTGLAWGVVSPGLGSRWRHQVLLVALGWHRASCPPGYGALGGGTMVAPGWRGAPCPRAGGSRCHRGGSAAPQQLQRRVSPSPAPVAPQGRGWRGTLPVSPGGWPCRHLCPCPLPACNVTIHNRCKDTLPNCTKVKQKVSPESPPRG